MERGDPERSDEGRGAGGVARRWSSGGEPLHGAQGDFAISRRQDQSGGPADGEDRGIHRRSLDGNALVVERRCVGPAVPVAGLLRVKLGPVVVRGSVVVLLTPDVGVVGESV
jgi:hypothetical protein